MRTVIIFSVLFAVAFGNDLLHRMEQPYRFRRGTEKLTFPTSLPAKEQYQNTMPDLVEDGATEADWDGTKAQFFDYTRDVRNTNDGFDHYQREFRYSDGRPYVYPNPIDDYEREPWEKIYQLGKMGVCDDLDLSHGGGIRKDEKEQLFKNENDRINRLSKLSVPHPYERVYHQNSNRMYDYRRYTFIDDDAEKDFWEKQNVDRFEPGIADGESLIKRYAAWDGVGINNNTGSVNELDEGSYGIFHTNERYNPDFWYRGLLYNNSLMEEFNKGPYGLNYTLYRFNNHNYWGRAFEEEQLWDWHYGDCGLHEDAGTYNMYSGGVYSNLAGDRRDNIDSVESCILQPESFISHNDISGRGETWEKARDRLRNQCEWTYETAPFKKYCVDHHSHVDFKQGDIFYGTPIFPTDYASPTYLGTDRKLREASIRREGWVHAFHYAGRDASEDMPGDVHDRSKWSEAGRDSFCDAQYPNDETQRGLCKLHGTYLQRMRHDLFYEDTDANDWYVLSKCRGPQTKKLSDDKPKLLDNCSPDYDGTEASRTSGAYCGSEFLHSHRYDCNTLCPVIGNTVWSHTKHANAVKIADRPRTFGWDNLEYLRYECDGDMSDWGFRDLVPVLEWNADPKHAKQQKQQIVYTYESWCVLFNRFLLDAVENFADKPEPKTYWREIENVPLDAQYDGEYVSWYRGSELMSFKVALRTTHPSPIPIEILNSTTKHHTQNTYKEKFEEKMNGKTWGGKGLPLRGGRPTQKLFRR
jgi:hypothetical protein